MEFSEIGLDAKTWIYQSDKAFTQDEKDFILLESNTFLSGWESHGKKVKGVIEIFDDQFIVIFADDEGDSLCGRAQDAQARFVKEMEGKLGKVLMDRMLLAYLDESGVKSVRLSEFIDLAKQGVINRDTIVFNNLIDTKEKFLSSWKVKAGECWHLRYL